MLSNMKTILINNHPQCIEKIIKGEKRIEIRPFELETPFKVVVYCTKKNDEFIKRCKEIQNKLYESHYLNSRAERVLRGVGKVVLEYVVNEVDDILLHTHSFEKKKERILRDSCLSEQELKKYLKCDINGKSNAGKAWYISQLKVFETPKELGDFFKIDCASEHCSSCNYSTVEKKGDRFQYICSAIVTRPPQNFMRVWEIKEL